MRENYGMIDNLNSVFRLSDRGVFQVGIQR